MLAPILPRPIIPNSIYLLRMTKRLREHGTLVDGCIAQAVHSGGHSSAVPISAVHFTYVGPNVSVIRNNSLYAFSLRDR